MGIQTNQVEYSSTHAKLVTINDVASHFRLGIGVIRTWMQLPDPLPHYRIGYRTLRFDMAEVSAWWTRQRETLAPSSGDASSPSVKTEKLAAISPAAGRAPIASGGISGEAQS